MKNTIITVLVILLSHIDLFSQVWKQIEKVTANDRETKDWFGRNVHIDGNYAAISAIFESHDTSGNNQVISSGSVYIYERKDFKKWQQVQKIIASDREIADYFGSSVCISGNILVVSARSEDHDANGLNKKLDAGSAYIFERKSNGKWIQIQKIVASDREAGDLFGTSVYISGKTIIISAPYDDHDAFGNNYLSNSGSAYIFEQDNMGLWVQTKKIVAKDRGEEDLFGISIGMSGSLIIVGASQEDEDTSNANTITNTGSAYIFEKNINGDWIEINKLVSEDRGLNDYFGCSVSIFGNKAIIGAFSEDDDLQGNNKVTDAGSAYIFEKNKFGKWQQAQKIISKDREISDRFGASVSLSQNFAVISSIWEDHDTFGLNTLSMSGSAYIFEKNDSNKWVQKQKIVANDRDVNAQFGTFVSISNNWGIIGAFQDKKDAKGLNTLVEAGSAYFFSNCKTTYKTDSINSCGSYKWIDGILYSTNNNSAKFTLINKQGCDSIVSLKLNIINIDTSTSILGYSIVSNQINGTYRWLDCKNNYAVILNEINKSYKPNISGEYAVEIKLGNCIDTSICKNVTSLKTYIVQNLQINIYPNPSNLNYIIIESNNKLEEIKYQLISTCGKLLEEGLINENVSKINVSKILNGVYFIKLIYGDFHLIKKIIINNP